MCEEREAGLPIGREILPEYSEMKNWELYSSDVLTEYRQSIDEGLDIARYQNLFQAVSDMPDGKAKDQISDILYQMVLNAPMRPDFPYKEPSELNEIKRLRDKYSYSAKKPEHLREKLLGAWTGRICGCLLGKPIEGIRTNELYPILKASGNYPLRRYILSTDITEEMCKTYTFDLKDKCYADSITCPPPDDDTNYTVLASVLIEKYGASFTPFDVSRNWLDNQGKNCFCTAEKVAFCNFIKGYVPPDSAIYKNPYREWIGAQIRGDYYGYINPGNPERAAEFAWRDASISHTKNGIYGEMFVAAMLAYAAVCDDLREIIMGGLAQIPSTSRLYEAVVAVVEGYDKGVSCEQFFDGFHNKYDEHDGYDWCHTIPNAMIVAAALLYGDGDYGRAICLAVQAGFDTDCNGATVGSVMGMRNGISGIGQQWTAPVHQELQTDIFHLEKVSIPDLVERTLRHIEQFAE